MKLKAFYFNNFREITYLLSDDAGQTVIIDCGSYTDREKQQVADYISQNSLTPRLHLLTHAHLDHLCGARFLLEKYNLVPYLSDRDLYYFNNQLLQSQLFGMPLSDEPIDRFMPIADYEVFRIGDIEIKSLPTPGHSPDGMSFYCESEGIVFSGDTLFYMSIGRFDMPRSNYGELMNSIRQELFSLPDDTKVYPGHGLDSQIGFEKKYNTYLQ